MAIPARAQIKSNAVAGEFAEDQRRIGHGYFRNLSPVQDLRNSLSAAECNYSLAEVFGTGMNKLTNSLLVLAAGGLMLAGSAAAQNNNTAGPGAVDPGHPRVNQVNRRQTRQQKRIAQGVKNGSLSPKETANLERREASVQRQEKRDMAKHNGHLTKAEQKQLNHRENRISRSIYKDKHNNK
jgi:hypothetical protein